MFIVYKKNILRFTIFFIYNLEKELWVILDPYFKIIVFAVNTLPVCNIRLAVKKKLT